MGNADHEDDRTGVHCVTRSRHHDAHIGITGTLCECEGKKAKINIKGTVGLKYEHTACGLIALDNNLCWNNRLFSLKVSYTSPGAPLSYPLHFN